MKRRSLLARLFTIDANNDGVVTGEEVALFLVARALLAVSIGFATWGWGTEIIGRAIVDNAGDFWLFKSTAWVIGFVLGGVVGAGASVLTAFGFNFAWRAFASDRWGVGLIIALGGVVGAGAVFVGMFFMFAGMLDSSWARYQDAKSADAAITEAVAAGRDSTLIAEEHQAAIADYERALEERQRALGWRDQVIACAQAGGGPCEDIRAIQVVLGVPDDGIVRGRGACAGCGDTAKAVDDALSSAETRVAAAQSRRGELTTVLEGIRSYEAGQGDGSAAGDLAAATNVAKLKVFVKGFIGASRTTYQIQSWISGEEHPALTRQPDGSTPPEALEQIEDRAFALGTGSAVGGALLLDFFNIVANVVLGMLSIAPSRAVRPRDRAAPLALPDRSGDPPPDSDGAQVVMRAGADPQIAASAPRQAWEPPERFVSRANAHLDSLRRELREERTGAYASEFEARVAKLRERKKRLDDERELEELEREVAKLERERANRDTIDVTPASVEERTTIRRSSTGPAPTAAPPPPPVVVRERDPGDLEEIERLRRELAARDAAAAASAKAGEAPAADLDRRPRDPNAGYGVDELEDLAARWNDLKAEAQRIDKEQLALAPLRATSPEANARWLKLDARLHVIHGDMVAIPDRARTLAALSGQTAG